MPNDKHPSDHEKWILGRRYDFSLKHIYNMTRRHDTRHHGFMYYIHEVISSHVSPCLSAKIPLRRFKAQKQFSCCFNHVVSIGVKMKVFFQARYLWREKFNLCLQSSVHFHSSYESKLNQIFASVLLSKKIMSDCVKNFKNDNHII